MSETATNPVASNLAPSAAGTVYLSPSNALALLDVMRLFERHCPQTHPGETELPEGGLHTVTVTGAAINSIRALLTAIDLDAPSVVAPIHLFTRLGRMMPDPDGLLTCETRAGRSLTMMEDEIPMECPFDLQAVVSEECFAWLVGHFAHLGQLEGGAI